MKTIIHEDAMGNIITSSLSLDARGEEEPHDAFWSRMVDGHVTGERHLMIETADLPTVAPERWHVNWDTGEIGIFPAPEPPATAPVERDAISIELVGLIQDVAHAVASLKSEFALLSGRIAVLEDRDAHIRETLKL